MMSDAAIRNLSAQAARRAAREHRIPLIVEQEDMATLETHLRHIPNFGDYRPKGWELVGSAFVDKSGWGGDNEPALSFAQFVTWIKAQGPGFGYALIEEGQFQVYVGKFSPVRKRRKT